MIEFKAECGHTVRAKDSDAGNVVRCSYCGKTANVPDAHQDDAIDFLFSEVDGSAGTAAAGTPGRRKKRKRPLHAGARRGTGEFNPFAFSLKLCYAAVLFIVVWVVAVKWVWPLFESGGRQRPPVAGTTTAPMDRRRIGEPSTPSAPKTDGGMGLVGLQGATGLYVASVPSGADVFYVPAAEAPPLGRRVIGAPNCKRTTTDAQISSVAPGFYVVEVVLPIKDKTLKRYPNYGSFRSAIESASHDQAQCERLMKEYFLPDDVDAMFIEDTEEQVYLIRQYRNVEVPRGGWESVRALFLPRIPHPAGQGYSIEMLITRKLIPEDRVYNFDELDVRSELAYYGVPDTERQYVIDALSRIGIVPFVTADNEVRLFKIRIEDGDFARKLFKDYAP